MPVSSMTGFARVEGSLGETRWVWELKSVNGRGLEPRFRLPPGYDFLDQNLRKALGEEFSRGSFNVFLSLKGAAVEGALSVNRAALESALAMIEDIRLRIDCEKPRPEGVLALRGVIEAESMVDDEDRRAELGKSLTGSFRDGVKALAAARRQEGVALHDVIKGQLDAIGDLTNAARVSPGADLAAIRERIAAQLGELLAGQIETARITEEAAMLAVKADIREELDRLEAHVAAGCALLKEKSAVGRRLDFLTQELNREANTLCSKAQQMSLKSIGLDLKTAIDQMREQVQNVE